MSVAENNEGESLRRPEASLWTPLLGAPLGHFGVFSISGRLRRLGAERLLLKSPQGAESAVLPKARLRKGVQRLASGRRRHILCLLVPGFLALLAAAQAAQACVCCCIFPVVTDPSNGAQWGTIVSGSSSAASLYNTGNSLMGKISSAVGSKGSIPTSSYSTLAAMPPDLSPVMAITASGLSTALPTLTSATTTGQWVTQALFTTATTAAATQATAGRRAMAQALAARYAYAVALASRTDVAASQQRAALLLQQGNAAKDQRTQIAAILQTIEAVRAEIVALQRIEEASLELQGTVALSQSPLAATYSTGN